MPSIAERRNAEQVRPPEKAKGPTSVRFAPNEYDWVNSMASALGVTQSDLVRWCVRYVRSQEPNIADDIVVVGKKTLRV